MLARPEALVAEFRASLQAQNPTPQATQKLDATPRPALYRARIERLTQTVAELSTRSARVGNLRGLFFLVGLGSLFWGAAGSGGAVSLATGAIGIVGFVVLVRKHAQIGAAEDYEARLLAVNERAERRVSGRFKELPDDGADLPRLVADALASPEQARTALTLSDDLDLFGRASLFQRISVARTRFGRFELARALLSPTDPPRIRRRQAAARALSSELELRQRIEALASALERKKQLPGAAAALDPEPLLTWAESEPRLTSRRAVVWGARLLTLCNLAMLAALWVHAVPASYLLAPLSLSLLLSVVARAETQAAFVAVVTREGALSGYDRLLEAIETMSASSELLDELKARLRRAESTPSRAMAELRSGVSYLELRYNALLYPLANLFLLWDIHCTLRLERWQQRYGKTARDWFRVLGEMEGLSSLAGMAFDEPELCFPELSREPRFEAKGLAHALLAPGLRVGNDLALGGPGTALLVTGSNMSGKSTLLRSVGVACVLSYAGGPVPAESLTLGMFRLGTSLRIRDSLEEGVSHFYAELGKLRAVLEATRGALPVLFLLDEILHGTNSVERQVGARWVISELLREQALGIVSTHDLELCALSPELMSRVELVHLREDVQGSEMTFDYRLRQGPVKAGNALRLMRKIGLAVPEV